MASRPATRSALPFLLTTSIGCAMALVDTNIVAIAVPAVTAHFGADAVASQWIVSAFFLCFAAALLPAGAMADRLGRRRVFVWGLAGLAAASLGSGLATAPLWLHLCRGIQGMMTAFVLAPALALIGHRFHEPADRNRAWAIWGGVMGGTMVVAPLAGGVIVETLGWRWAFFVNVPICAALAGSAIVFADESRGSLQRRLDPAGILCFATAMFGFTWGLINGPAQGWASAMVLGGFAIGGLALAAFVVAERVQAAPMLNLALFREPSFIGAVWAMVVYAATAQVMASLFPIVLQSGAGLSATATGLAMLPFAIAMLVFPCLGARLGRHVASPAILALGLLVVALGNALAAWAVSSGHWPTVFAGMFVIGSGAGLLNGETQKAIMMTIPRDQTGMASGISTTARFGGILIGFAGLNAIMAAVRPGSAAPGGAAAAGAAGHANGFAAALFVAAIVAALSAWLVRRLMRQDRGR